METFAQYLESKFIRPLGPKTTDLLQSTLADIDSQIQTHYAGIKELQAKKHKIVTQMGGDVSDEFHGSSGQYHAPEITMPDQNLKQSQDDRRINRKNKAAYEIQKLGSVELYSLYQQMQNSGNSKIDVSKNLSPQQVQHVVDYFNDEHSTNASYDPTSHRIFLQDQ